MSDAAPPPSPTAALAMVRTLGIVSAVCGLLIVGAYQQTYSAVSANKKLAVERGVFKVVPGASVLIEYSVGPTGITPAGSSRAPVGSLSFYAAYDEAGSLRGIAAEAAAKGYADVVRLLYGYSPRCQCITGIGVVSMRETPGIGDKILSDKDFLANFTALDVTLNEETNALAHAVKTVKHGTKSNPWEIDAISGATVTSKAVGKGIDDSAQRLLPKLVPALEKLRTRS